MSFGKRYQRAFNITWPWSTLFFLTSTLVGFIPWLLLEPETEYLVKAVLRYQAPQVSANESVLTSPRRSGNSVNQSSPGALNKDLLLANESFVGNENFVGYWREEISKEAALKGLDIVPRSILSGQYFDLEFLPQTEADIEDSWFRYQATYKSENREQPEAILNSFGRALARTSRNENIWDRGIVRDNLKKEEALREQGLQEARTKLENFSNLEKPSLLLIGEASSLTSEITSIQQSQRQLEVQLQSLDVEIQGLQTRLALTPSEAYVSAALSADPIISDLQAQIYDADTQITSLRQELQPSHPEVVALQHNLDSFETQLQQRMNDVVGNADALIQSAAANFDYERIRQLSSLDPARQELANQLSGLQTQRMSLENQRSILTEAEQQLRLRLEEVQSSYNLPTIENEEILRRSDFDAKRQQYEQVKAIRSQSELQYQTAESNWELEQIFPLEESMQPQPIEKVIFPLGGLLAGIVAAGCIPLIILNERLLNTQEVDDVLKEISTSGLSVKAIPSIPGWFRGDDDIALAIGNNEKYLAAFEGLRTGDDPFASVMITSIQSGDGKSSVAYNLALAAAQTGCKTLLVELDLRSVSVATNLASVTAKSDPLSATSKENYYKSQLHEQIRPAGEIMPEGIDASNLWILPSQPAGQNLRKTLESEPVTKLLKDVRNEYKYVVVDAPSMWIDNAATSLLDDVEASLLVVRPRNTPLKRFKEVAELLHRQHAERFAGVVVRDAKSYKNFL